MKCQYGHNDQHTSRQGGQKQIFYGGARLKRKKNFLPEFGKFCNFYYINPKKMGGLCPLGPPSSVHPDLSLV